MNITPDVYQFSQTLDFMDFTLHQYLLCCAEPMLMSTGTVQQAEVIIPKIKRILGDIPLAWILVSHTESDECGGIFRIHGAWPEAVVVCSELTARELYGFGYTGQLRTVKEGDVLQGADYALEVISYPAEVHLQNGCLFYEQQRRILFSSDLLLSFGRAAGQTKDAHWYDAVEDISLQSIPNAHLLEVTKQRLLTLEPSFVAVGHGYCLNLLPTPTDSPV